MSKLFSLSDCDRLQVSTFQVSISTKNEKSDNIYPQIIPLPILLSFLENKTKKFIQYSCCFFPIH